MFRVLLPVDTDEQKALAAAKTVTSLPDVENSVHVTILNVQEEFEVSGEGGAYSGGISSDNIYDETAFPASTVEAKEYLENAGVPVEMTREHANPGSAILEMAEEIDADRIVMTGRKRTPAGKVLFGSVIQSVMLNSSVPVTAVLNY